MQTLLFSKLYGLTYVHKLSLATRKSVKLWFSLGSNKHTGIKKTKQNQTTRIPNYPMQDVGQPIPGLKKYSAQRFDPWP